MSFAHFRHPRDPINIFNGCNRIFVVAIIVAKNELHELIIGYNNYESKYVETLQPIRLYVPNISKRLTTSYPRFSVVK